MDEYLLGEILYIVFAILAFVVCFIVLYLKKINKIDLYNLYFINVASIVTGAKLSFLIERSLNLSLDNFLRGGYVFTGGILIGIIFTCLYCKVFKLAYEVILSKVVLIYPLFYFIAKIGCFFAKCCYGIKYNGLFSVVRVINGISYDVLPIQLIESIIMFLIFVILIRIKERKKVILYFLGLYGVFRFFSDYLRGVRYAVILNLTITQIICILFIVIVIIYNLLYKFRKRDRQTEEIIVK